MKWKSEYFVFLKKIWINKRNVNKIKKEIEKLNEMKWNCLNEFEWFKWFKWFKWWYANRLVRWSIVLKFDRRWQKMTENDRRERTLRITIQKWLYWAWNEKEEGKERDGTRWNVNNSEKRLQNKLDSSETAEDWRLN